MIRRFLETFTAAVFPFKCLRCGHFFRPTALPGEIPPLTSTAFHSLLLLDEEILFKAVMAPFLCDECSDGFLPVMSSMGGATVENQDGGDQPGEICPQSSGNIQSVNAVGVYDKALMAVIHCFKYKGRIQLARPLGLLLLALFLRCYGREGRRGEKPNTDEFPVVDVIVPVPLHIRRFRKRGYNQAWLLIRHWIKWLEVMNGCRPGLTIDRRSLIKRRHTRSQTHFGRAERQNNVSGAYFLKNTAAIAGRHVLLIDDVYTTGATVEECARILLDGGARRVDALTVARAVAA